MQVLVYHAWSVGSPIGVDAFIMISAYLMTSSFVRRTERGRMPFFVERWVNTFKRLLPPLVATVLVTVAVSMVVLPRTRWGELITQGIASVTYWQNWRLAEVSADYFAANRGVASPLQHLWSMSMQGQVFLAWPLLMAGCVVLARVVGVRPRKVVLVAFALLAVLSLGWLLTTDPGDPAVYFDTRARVWEFALGSAVAAAAPWIRPRGVVARVLSWAGFVTLVVYCVVSIGRYPGPMAAVPMVSVSVILLADAAPVAGSVQRLLSWRPLVALGDMSYSVYLIHWPVFVLFMAQFDRAKLGLRGGVILIAASLLFAWFMTRFVDGPAQRFPRTGRVVLKKTMVVLVSLAVGLVPLVSVDVVLDRSRAAQLSSALDGAGDPDHTGAEATLEQGPVDYTAEPIPGPLAVGESWIPDLPEPCPPGQQELFGETQTLCSSMPASNQGRPRVVIVGDSHIEQMITPVALTLASRHDFELSQYLMGGCSFGQPEYYEGDCRLRNEVVLDMLTEDPPDVVMLSTTAAVPDSPDETLRPGVKEMVEQLSSLGVVVIGFRDNPRSNQDLYECSSERPSDTPFGGCSFQQSHHLAQVDPAVDLLMIPQFHQVDPTDLYCIDGECYTIIGNVYVYLDDNHISGPYALTMAPILADRVEPLLGL
nr:acyltransferase family protein [Propionibacterium australiense]